MTDITLPTVGADADSWGTELNAALTSLQTQANQLKNLGIAIGTVSSGAAAATIRGAAPNYLLDLTLPKGDTGAATNLTIGTVARGTTASATITGTAPDLTLNLVLPKGDKGDTGDQGPKGDPGSGSVDTVNGDPGPDVVLTAASVGAVPSSALGAANGVATLAPDGTLVTSQLPALALVNVTPVASQAAMLALSGVQPGDLATRTDGAGTFMLTATPASTLANWTLLNAPTDEVVSVNGQTGTVNLAASDVGAAPTTRAITAGSGLTGGGDLSADRSLAVSYGTTAGTAAVGNDSRITGAAQKASNLSDLADAATARGNLGLGSAAVKTAGSAAGNVPVLNASALVDTSALGSGAASSSTYLRGDGSWAAPSGGGGGVLAYVVYSPSAAVTLTIVSGAAPVNVDATHLSITFTAPASGNVVVRLSAAGFGNAANGTLLWSLRQGSTNIATTERFVYEGTVDNRINASMYVTGLTPGTSYTYRWAARTNGANFTFVIGGGNEFTAGSFTYGPATMEVWSA